MDNKDNSEKILKAKNDLLASSGGKTYDRQKAIILMAKMLRHWRKRAGLTQAELKEKTGIIQSTISRIESSSNRSIPSMETIIEYAHGCGHPVTIGMPSEFANSQLADKEKSNGKKNTVREEREYEVLL